MLFRSRALVCVFLACFIGLPVKIIAKNDASANLFITSGIVFVGSWSVLLFMFVPKILHEHPKYGNSISNRVTMAVTAEISDIGGTGDLVICTDTREELILRNHDLSCRNHDLSCQIKDLEEEMNGLLAGSKVPETETEIEEKKYW